ncbi:GTPase-activating protein skywalker isoform X1 [Hydra vulgaris]|uniref:GTPase-activating protein skywalker isoform X1 n=2 Tax=Hydra vulgaris TaxID=6087 RepID=UPI0006416FF8|nr:GTPase-activating protein skywalker isoform X1 [Hydra vulgaris]XP_047129117.1 GTPase-activating protein skywalker isoform X1 [Hydra vulgaris]XP_047129118.1 GTPase-activating protein skywalker isoform X1 [Hydra vulgaris]
MECNESSDHFHLQPHVDSNAHKSISILEAPPLDVKESNFISSILVRRNRESLSTKDLHKLKEITRKNIPPFQRSHFWIMFSGGLEVKKITPNLYKDVCDDLLKDNNGQCKSMKLTSNSHYLTPMGCFILQKVLLVINELNPDIIYCPMLEQLGAVMLHFMDEEDVFACLTGILNRDLIEQTKTSNIISDTTLQDLLKLKEKKVYSKLESYVTSHAEAAGHKLVIFPSLRKFIFDRLSLPHLVRIVDCFLVEGPKIFYRVGLYLLNLFYTHSLTFKHLFCSSPHVLVATIGQYMLSLQIAPDIFIKSVLKISLKSKQLVKLKQTNMAMSNSHNLDYTEDLISQQVVTINLHEVSDIIDPIHWQIVCGWLPLRMQIKKPFLLFTTNNDGCSLKTLYNKCEGEEQTLMIFRTASGEILGAYLSSSLMDRHDGHQNLSFFGTGETFIFTLTPKSTCYHWNGSEQVRSKVSTYVFVKPHCSDEEDAFTGKSMKRKGSSFVRTLSRRFSRRFLHTTPSETPLDIPKSTINANHIKNNFEDEDDSPISIKPIENESANESGALNEQPRGNKDTKLPLSNKNGVLFQDKTDGKNEHVPCVGFNEEQFEIVKETNGLPHKSQIHAEPVADQAVHRRLSPDKNETDEHKRVALYISCDETRMVIGGGDGEGIAIDGDIHTGRSTWCRTFDNDPLSSGEHGDFTIIRLDVFGFH